MTERLRAAVDRAAARSAAYDVARVAVDDAVAVTPGAAAPVVVAVRGLLEAGTRWRADALGVLIYVVDHAYVHRGLRAGKRTYRGEWDRGVAEEEAVERALAGFDGVVRDMLDDPDAETRSLASLVLARVSGEPVSDRDLLRLLWGAEPDGRVRASLVEALLRLGEPVGDWMVDGVPQARARLAWYLAAARRHDDPALAALVGAEQARAQPSWRWLAEEP